MSTQSAPPPVILDRYRLIGPLGSGATSAVYRARDLRTGDPVAVKLVPDHDGLGLRARREISVMGRLSHPAICELTDWGRHGDVLALVLEFAQGRPLRSCWDDERIRPRLTLEVVVQVLQALAHAHARNVIHRDVTPANILVDRYGDARLIDFGVATAQGDPELTRAGDLVGTVAYMAPEQARGEPVSRAVDVWAAAMVAYHGIVGQHPLTGRSQRDTLTRVAAGKVPPIRRIRSKLAPELERALTSALDPDPLARPHAIELAARLAAIPISSPRRTAERRPASASRVRSAVAGFGSLAGAGRRARRAQA